MTPSATTLSPTGVVQPAKAGAVEPSANATTAGKKTALTARTRTPASELSLVRNADYLGRLYACRATTVQSMRWRPRHRAHQHAARGRVAFARQERSAPGAPPQRRLGRRWTVRIAGAPARS